MTAQYYSQNSERKKREETQNQKSKHALSSRGFGGTNICMTTTDSHSESGCLCM